MTTAKKTASAPKSTRKALAPDPRTSAPPAAKPVPQPHAAAAALIASGVDPEGSLRRRPTSEEKARASRNAELVEVTVPRAFKFTVEDHSMIDYPPGAYEMPRGHAEDSFAQAHGVQIITK